jgi:hypothetical protein
MAALRYNHNMYDIEYRHTNKSTYSIENKFLGLLNELPVSVIY